MEGKRQTTEDDLLDKVYLFLDVFLIILLFLGVFSRRSGSYFTFLKVMVTIRGALSLFYIAKRQKKEPLLYAEVALSFPFALSFLCGLFDAGFSLPRQLWIFIDISLAIIQGLVIHQFVQRD